MISRRASLASMVIIVLLGFASAAAQLNADILWVDEMHSVSAFGAKDLPHSIGKIIESIATRTPEHVPLYYLVGAGWARLVGWSQIALRYLSLLFGVLTIAWVYRFGADVFNRRAGLLAALLFATNAMVIIYFHEMRNYALWMLLSIMHAWQYWRLVSGAEAGWASWTAFAATTSALLYTHPFSAFVLLGLGIHHLLMVAKDRRWLCLVFAWGAGVLTFLPYLPSVLSSIAVATDSRSVQAEGLSSIQLIPMLANVSANGVTLLWLVILAAGAWTFWRRRSPEVLRVLVIFVALALSLLIFHAIDPFVSSRRLRYFLVVMILALVLFAHLLTSIPRWRILAPVFVLVWLAGGRHIYQLAEKWEYAGHHSLLVAHPPLHRFTDALQHKLRPLDVMLGFTQAGFLNDGLYYGFSTVDYYSETVLGIHGAFIWTQLEGSELSEEFDRRVDNHPYLLLTYEPDNPPANFKEVSALLEQDYQPCEVVVDTPPLFVQRYALASLACDREYQPIHYDNGIEIVDKFAEFDAGAETLRIITGWQVAADEQLEQYNVSVQIITPDWQRARQAPDRHLYDGILPWYAVEISTADLPPGDYSAMVILYDRYTNKKVSGVDIATGQSGDIFSILSFTIGP